MLHHAKWIWTKLECPDHGLSAISVFDKENISYPFTVIEFLKQVTYQKQIQSITVSLSADVRFRFFVNKKFYGIGPVCAGGDYDNAEPMPYIYYNTYKIPIDSKELTFYLTVQNQPTVLCDTSRGKCGLILSCRIHFCDGSEEVLYSDESWLSRIHRPRIAPSISDFTLIPENWNQAEIVDIPHQNLKKSPIPNLVYEDVIPEDFSEITLLPGEEKIICYTLDRIYSGYYHLQINASDSYHIKIRDYERYPEKAANAEDIRANASISFYGIEMRSVGAFELTIKNEGNSLLTICKAGLLFSHYPVGEEGNFSCSDQTLTKIYHMGKWALKICKQTIELDSPSHQENLGCAGDYHIASLMNYFTHDDTELTRFDLVRISDYLKMRNGYMFHTTYSMIWILMLYEYYQFTNDKALLSETAQALILLLERFSGYVGKTGVIDNPPNYMFVDWLIVDDFTLHHPPMCLGQSVLNAFYYGGLQTAVKIFTILGDTEHQMQYKKRAEQLYHAFEKNFYDANRGLYHDGLNDTYPEKPWLPQNSDKRYFSWHTNSLVALFELCDAERARKIMENILNDMSLINPQPYFMHFVIEAIYKTGLFPQYGLQQLRRWECMTDFEKGLQEGWYAPGDYAFDYSHVWAGTPTYQLPSKLSGFEMLEPGFKKISLKPELYGLSYADIRIPTPYGKLELHLKKGEAPKILCDGTIEFLDNRYIIHFSQQTD